jgi:NhaP-type Na+/H+ or K+/H+ antiporter
MVFAFMAQHVWEVGASVFAVFLIGQGLFWLIKGSSVPRAQGMSERAARTIGGLAALIGVGVSVAAFLVHAEQPGVHRGDGWGGVTGIVVLTVWVVLMCLMPLIEWERRKGRSR